MGTDTTRTTGITSRTGSVVAPAARCSIRTESPESGAGPTGLLLNLTRRDGSSGAPLDRIDTRIYLSRRIA
jgi:hypothetical protein